MLGAGNTKGNMMKLRALSLEYPYWFVVYIAFCFLFGFIISKTGVNDIIGSCLTIILPVIGYVILAHLNYRNHEKKKKRSE